VSYRETPFPPGNVSPKFFSSMKKNYVKFLQKNVRQPFFRLKTKFPVDNFVCPFCGLAVKRRRGLYNHDNTNCKVYETHI